MEEHPQKSKKMNEGSYGCVYTPPLPCKDSKVVEDVTIGKVMDKKDASIELAMSIVLRGIPGWQRYYILQKEDGCTRENFTRMRSTYSPGCKIYSEEKNAELTQILSRYGGTTLNKMRFTPKFDYIGALRHVLEGVDKLNKQGICHNDIHERNIVVDENGTFRLIDFGHSFFGDSVTQNTADRYSFSFTPEYEPQPPELSVQNGIVQKYQASLFYMIEQSIEKKHTLLKAQTHLGLMIEDQIYSLRDYWSHSETALKEDWVSLYKQHWKTWDAWAVGIVFVKLLEQVMRLTHFQKEVWETHGRILRDVLRGLLQANPKKRFTAAKALEVLSTLS